MSDPTPPTPNPETGVPAHGLLDQAPTTTGGGEPPRPVDAESASLFDALRLSFRVLQVAILALLVVSLLYQGFFYVAADEVAVRTRFGAITDEEPLTSEGGPYFKLPSLIDEVIRVKTSPQTLVIDRAFWYDDRRQNDRSREEFAATLRRTGIDPTVAGVIVTGDGGLYHARLAVNWRVRPEDAARFVGAFARDDAEDDLTARAEAAGVEGRDVSPMVRARRVVATVAEQAVAEVGATLTVEQFRGGQNGADLIAAAMTRRLADMGTGVTVESVQFGDQTVALQALQEYNASTEALQQAGQQLVDARGERNNTLTATAGSAYEPLLAVLDVYEIATRDGDDEVAELARTAGRDLLAGTPADVAVAPLAERVEDPELRDALAAARPVTVSGDAAQVVSEAGRYQTQVVQDVQADLERFSAALAASRDAPILTRQRLYREFLEQVYGGSKEVVLLPPGRTELVIPRDASIDDRRAEEQALRESEEAARRANTGNSALQNRQNQMLRAR